MFIQSGREPPICAEVIVSIMNADVDRIFHYIVPDGMEGLAAGCRVAVPFGGRRVEGCVVGFSAPQIESGKLKAITAMLDDYPLLTPVMLELARWMKIKYYTTLAACLRCVAPSWAGTWKRRRVMYARIVDNGPEAARVIIDKGGPQALVLQTLTRRAAVPVAALIKDLGISMSPVNTLAKKGLIVLEDGAPLNLKPVDLTRDNLIKDDPIKDNFVLTDEQDLAVRTLLDAAATPGGKPWLVHGVTGSGKTEIYMRLIESALAAGKQAVMLVPEISLTPQAVDAFKRRFGGLVAVTHSRLSQGERLAAWQMARTGEVSVMIGPRSAIFTPFVNLGVVIIDEEHEKTYFSETSPKYAVADVAAQLSELTGALIVLGSATPSVETYYKTAQGQMGLITLNKRVNNRFPAVEIADLRTELAEGNRSIFSRALLKSMEESLALGRQVILFMNRRGHSTFVSCRSCGYVLACEHCSVNYTYHIHTGRMLCHYCGAADMPPALCPVCESRHIRYFGVGTQKIEEEVRRLFPGVAALRMDMDTTGRKNSHENIIRRFAGGDAQILIGTQMIAKGLNFPGVSLVGIVDADTSLNTGDFRAPETAFQLITQVSGRAGRADIPGKVIIQTYNPEHYSIAFAQNNDYKSFYNHEIRLRKAMSYPPFGDIFMVLMSATDERRLITILSDLGRLMTSYNRKGFFEILGPTAAVIAKINKLYRWKILVKSTAPEDILIQFIFHCIAKLTQSTNLSDLNLNLTLNPRVLA